MSTDKSSADRADGDQRKDDSKRSAQISKAPPPIRALPDRPLRLPASNLHFEKPDWEKWRRFSIARLWEVACLAADIEPPQPGGDGIWYEDQLKEFPARFHEVWQVVNRDSVLSTLPLQPYSGRMLHRTDIDGFAQWAIAKGLALPAPLVERAAHDAETASEPPTHPSAIPSTQSQAEPEAGLTKREQQIRAIEAGADALKYTRTAIPNGGKKAIMEWCKSNHSKLFGVGDDPFKDAWKEASKAKRVTMANRAKFVGE